jgi:hypothetical protein
MTKKFIALLVVLTAMSSAVFAAEPSAVETEEIVKIKGFSSIEGLLAEANLPTLDFSKGLAKGIESRTITKDGIEKTFSSVIKSLEETNLPDGVTKSDVRALLAGRIYALYDFSNCGKADCGNALVTGTVSASSVLETLASGKELLNMEKWNKNSKGFKNMVRFFSLVSVRLQQRRGSEPAPALIASDIKEAAEQFIKENNIKLSLEEFLKALIANCA